MLERLKQKKLGKKGFTLAELLIVVAIIAILVAIAIPTFNGALDKAKKSTDDANIRAAYAESQIHSMDDSVPAATVNSNEITFGDGTKYTLQYYDSVDTTKGRWVGVEKKAVD